MVKPLVFISHIAAEAEVAIEFKSLIETHFLDLINVFVSSDGHTIQMGEKWLDNISSALKNCSVEIVICSPMSVERPWINFEAGAGWVRGIPVIPLCHSGMTPSDLPIPLNMLQAAKLTDISGLKFVFTRLAEALGANTPNVDFTQFVQKVTAFEKRYTFWENCNGAFQTINQHDEHIIPDLRAGRSVDLNLTELQLNKLKPATDYLTAEAILDFQRLPGATLNPSGMFNTYRLSPHTKFSAVAHDPNWKWR